MSLSVNPEINIIKKFVAGDDDAYSVIYHTYAKELYSYGRGLGFGTDAVKDAIQDLFYTILCKRRLLADVINIKYYLFRALKNRLLNLERSSDFSREELNNETGFHISITALDKMIDDEERIALEKRIQDLLNCLTSRQKEAVYLRYINELSYEEIADLLNMTPPSVRNLISRAIDRMRKDNVLTLFMSLVLSL
ncbi:MAG TPA: sigma-70 family RNA polymerase sigma factor [Bacteroidales bacterium]|nr:sigma-70 family RNA polymerase sigma factor [Bacteroidales bacterium]